MAGGDAHTLLPCVPRPSWSTQMCAVCAAPWPLSALLGVPPAVATDACDSCWPSDARSCLCFHRKQLRDYEVPHRRVERSGRQLPRRVLLQLPDACGESPSEGLWRSRALGYIQTILQGDDEPLERGSALAGGACIVHAWRGSPLVAARVRSLLRCPVLKFGMAQRLPVAFAGVHQSASSVRHAQW